MLFQPCTRSIHILGQRFHSIPEMGRVITMNKVGRFMRRHIIQNCIWSHHQSPRKIKIALIGTRAPPRFSVTNADPSSGASQQRSFRSDPVRQQAFGFGFEPIGDPTREKAQLPPHLQNIVNPNHWGALAGDVMQGEINA